MSLSQSKPRVVCVGTAVHDHVFQVETIPTTASKHRAKAFKAVGGGNAATAAVAAARLGAASHLVIQTGADAIGDLILAELAQQGVDCSLARRVEGCASSVSAVIVDGAGERLILNYLDPSMPKETVWLPELPEGTGAVLADIRWPEGGLAMLRRARAAGVPAVLDADLPFTPVDMIEAATIVAFSAPGLRVTSGLEDLEAGLRKVARLSDAVMMVTDGERGVLWLEGDALRHCPAFPVKAVDTLGAGDVFHGALAVAAAEGMDLAAAARFASAAAALKVTRFGGRAGAPERAEVDALLAAG